VVKNVFKKYSPNGTETPPKLLRSSFITFVRSSNAAPEVLKSAATVMKHRLETQASDVSVCAHPPLEGPSPACMDAHLRTDLHAGEFTATSQIEFVPAAGLRQGLSSEEGRRVSLPGFALLNASGARSGRHVCPGRDEPPLDPSSKATHDRLAAASFGDLSHSKPMPLHPQIAPSHPPPPACVEPLTVVADFCEATARRFDAGARAEGGGGDGEGAAATNIDNDGDGGAANEPMANKNKRKRSSTAATSRKRVAPQGPQGPQEQGQGGGGGAGVGGEPEGGEEVAGAPGALVDLPAVDSVWEIPRVSRHPPSHVQLQQLHPSCNSRS
jgi:hypothetical protein